MKNIFIIEDEVIVAKNIAALLNDEGYEIEDIAFNYAEEILF